MRTAVSRWQLIDVYKRQVYNTGKIDTVNVDVQADQGAALRNDGTIGEIVGGSYMGHPDTRCV